MHPGTLCKEKANKQTAPGASDQPGGGTGLGLSQPDQSGQEQDQPNQQGPAQPRLGPGGIPIIENPTALVAGGNTQNAGNSGQGQPGAGGQPGQGGGQPGQPGRTGADIIGGLLTTPVPGGLEGIQQRRGISASGANASQGFGAGIAGVASQYEMRGIKVFNEQDSIHKWEFVFDARQASGSGQNQSGARTPGPQGIGGAPTFNPTGRTGRQPGGMNQPGMGQPGMPGTPPAPPRRP
jgi:hypothetical protein